MVPVSGRAETRRSSTGSWPRPGWRLPAVRHYDALDRLVADVTVSKYAYDVLARRIAERVYSGPDAGYVRYLYRGGEVAAEPRPPTRPAARSGRMSPKKFCVTMA